MYIYLSFLHATVWRAIFGWVERARLFVSTSSPDIITIIPRVSGARLTDGYNKIVIVSKCTRSLSRFGTSAEGKQRERERERETRTYRTCIWYNTMAYNNNVYMILDWCLKMAYAVIMRYRYINYMICAGALWCCIYIMYIQLAKVSSVNNLSRRRRDFFSGRPICHRTC